MKINLRMILLLALSILLAFFLGSEVSYTILYVNIVATLIAVMGITYIKYRIKIFVNIEDSVINRKDKVKISINITGTLPFYYIRIYPMFMLDIDEYYEGEIVACNFNNTIVNKELECIKRGIYDVGNITIKIEDLLGLCSTTYTINTKREFTVLPLVYNKKPNLKYSNNNLYRNTRNINEVNDCIEGIREYLSGDSLKTVNWKVTAKRQELFINEYKSHKGEEVIVILDMNEKNYNLGSLEEEEQLITLFLSIINYCSNNNINCITMINNYLKYNLDIRNRNDLKNLVEYLLTNYSIGIREIDDFIREESEDINKKEVIVIVTYICNEDLISSIEKNIRKDARIEIFCRENLFYKKLRKNISIIN